MDHISRLQRASESPGIGAGVPRKGTAVGESNRSYTVFWGTFRLFASQRLLLEDHRPVNIGSRATDILIALITRPGRAGYQTRAHEHRMARYRGGGGQSDGQHRRTAPRAP
jgi:hypothetical protein